MRKKLKQKGFDERHTFTGTFERFGIKRGYKGPVETVLLVDIFDSNGKKMTDHLWFNKTKGFASLDLKEGDIIQFDARVAACEKGYKGYREDVYAPIKTDYKLSYPTKISIIGRQNK